jgi:alpha-beta hydrolase superfamily lysophospholipase
VVLIGHSMGGMIAARYAQRHGDELTALVLTGPVIGRWETAEQLLAEDEIPDTAIDPETLSRDPKVRKAYEEDELVYRGPFQRETLEALQACLRRIHEEGSIELPTLWIHGEQDELVPVGPSREGVRELVPEEHRTEDVRSGARHEVFNEIDHDAVLDEVTEFIDRHIG